MAQASRDNNRVPTLLGVSSIDSITPTTAAVNPTTHAVIVEATIDTGDIEIGAVEIKDGTTDTRATVGANGLYVDVKTQPLTSGVFGQAKIAVTGTAVQLGSNVLTNGVIITALSTNAGIIKIAGSGVTNVSDGTGNGYLLEAGASVSVAATNSNVLYINGMAGDCVSFMGC